MRTNHVGKAVLALSATLSSVLIVAPEAGATPVLSVDAPINVGRNDETVLADERGYIWVANMDDHTVGAITITKGGTPTYGTPFSVGTSSEALALDRKGNLWVSDYENAVYRVKSPTSNARVVEEPLVTGAWPNDMAVDANGDLWVANNAGKSVQRITKATKRHPAISSEIALGHPANIMAFDTTGNLWVTSYPDSKLIRVTDPSGKHPKVKVFDLPHGPWGLVAGPKNSLFVTAYDSNQIVKVTKTTAKSPTFTTLAGTTSATGPSCLVWDRKGRLWVRNEGGTGDGSVQLINGAKGSHAAISATSATVSGSQYGLRDCAVDILGNLWVAASDHNVVQRITITD